MSDKKMLFAEHTVDEVESRVRKGWRFEEGFIPIPNMTISCPICGSREVHYSSAAFWEKEESDLERVDVGFKCTWCSAFWIHGVPVTRYVYETAMQHCSNDKGQFHWRELKQLLGSRV